MLSNPWIKWTILVVIFIALLPVFYFSLNYLLAYLPILGPGSDVGVGAPLASFSLARPQTILIPKINVSAPVISVGLTTSGAMGAPAVPMQAGWYSPGTAPGDLGSAVIDGHRGWHGGIPAVFDNLHELGPGDTIYIKNYSGQTLAFNVIRTAVYKASDNLPEIWSRNDGRYLNLITCSGDWDSVAHSSKDRLVVYAKLAS